VSLIGKASHGLMRRVNILADKSLLAAFVQNTHQIEAKHVQAAIRDSEITPDKPWIQSKNAIFTGVAALLAIVIAGAGWMIGKSDHGQNVPAVAATIAAAPAAPIPSPQAPAVVTPPVVVAASTPVVSTANLDLAQGITVPAKGTLLQQRIAAGKIMLSQIGKGGVSIQLFNTEDARTARMEGFLRRAKGIEQLPEIFVIPIKINGKNGFRVLYGAYPNSEAARNGMKNLPQRYKDAFAPTLHDLDNY
jgi:septal ring-binding cell division protein DamX